MICPTCNGTGNVRDPDDPATPSKPYRVLPTGPTASISSNTGSCSCDGPPHAWSPPWCPESGPVHS